MSCPTTSNALADSVLSATCSSVDNAELPWTYSSLSLRRVSSKSSARSRSIFAASATAGRMSSGVISMTAGMARSGGVSISNASPMELAFVASICSVMVYL